MAALAISLAWGIQQRLEERALRQAADAAAIHISNILSPALQLFDFTRPLSQPQYVEIDTLIRNHVLREHVVRVKLWNSTGLLIYSDDKELVGQVFPPTDELGQALAGNVAMEISSLEKEENVGERGRFGQRLLEAYVPIRLNSGSVIGAYEIYQDTSQLEPSIAEMRRFVWGSTLIGFALLYGALFGLIRNASRELVERNAENLKLYQEVKQSLEERTRAEEHLREHAVRLELLNRASRSLAGTLDLAQVTEQIVSVIAQRFDGFLSAVLLYDEAAEEVVTFAAAGWGASGIEPGARIALGHGLIGQAAQARQLQLSNDTLADPIFVPLPGQPVRAEVVIPILREDKLLGVLDVASPQPGAFQPSDLVLLQTLAAQLAPAIESARLYSNLSQAYEHTLNALVAALDTRDRETEGHSQRVVSYTLAIAARFNFSPSDLTDLRRGALLHDIGKIGVPDAILLKPGPLTSEEWHIMRSHPDLGASILSSISFLGNAAKIVHAHHEKWDGTGYPCRLSGEDTPIGARIFAVADALDAMTSDRPYRAARGWGAARAEILDKCGTQFDPEVVEAFASIPEADWKRLSDMERVR